MQRIIGILIVVGIFSLISAEAQEKNDSIPNYLTETENYDSLLVFIGTKVRIHEYKVKADKFHIAFDRAFKAKYKVLEVVHGEYQESLIEFNVFCSLTHPRTDQK